MSTETLSAEQLIDALAYVDPAPTGALKDVVDALVDAEAEVKKNVGVNFACACACHRR